MEEKLFSLPNMFWFAAGIAAELFFLGYGVTPAGMSMGSSIAETFGMVAAPAATEGVVEVATSIGPAFGV